MACSTCNKRRKQKAKDKANAKPTKHKELFGDYKYLSHKQIVARLEAYKRKNCKSCDKRYTCDYAMYLGCKGEK